MENHISVMQKRKTTLGQRTFMTRNFNDKDLLKRGSSTFSLFEYFYFQLIKVQRFHFSAYMA
mgnify:CR=1 FL=1